MPGKKTRKKRRLMRVREACEYVSVSRNTLMKLIEDGKVTAYRQGGLIMVDQDTLDRYFESLPRIPPVGGRRER